MLRSVSDIPADLAQLRAIEAYLAARLQEVRGRIARLEEPEPGFVLQRMRTRADLAVYWLHRTDCVTASGTPLDRAGALEALGRPGVRPCEGCRPDEDLRAP